MIGSILFLVVPRGRFSAIHQTEQSREGLTVCRMWSIHIFIEFGGKSSWNRSQTFLSLMQERNTYLEDEGIIKLEILNCIFCKEKPFLIYETSTSLFAKTHPMMAELSSVTTAPLAIYHL